MTLDILKLTSCTRKHFPNEVSQINRSISSRVDRASATETVDSGSITGRVKLKTIKIDIQSFPAWRSALKGQCEASTVCGRLVGRRQLDSKTERSFAVS